MKVELDLLYFHIYMGSRKRDCSMIYLQSNLTKMSTLLQIHFSSLPGIRNTQIYLAPFLVLHISSIFSLNGPMFSFTFTSPQTHTHTHTHTPYPSIMSNLSTPKGNFDPKKGYFIESTVAII